MYKVLAEIVEEKGEKTRGESNYAVGGRVRSEAAKKAVAKAIAKNVNDLDNMGLVDLKTGAIKSKRKGKSKEKSPEEMALKDVKAYVAKFLALHPHVFVIPHISIQLAGIQIVVNLIFSHPRLKKAINELESKIVEMGELQIPNSSELVP